MKRSLSLVVVLMTVLGLLAGGAYAEDKPYAGQEITFWMQKYGNDPDRQAKMLDQMTAEFLELTGITVNYSLIDWGQANTKYTLAVTGGDAPDVADTFWGYSWAAIGGDEYGPMSIDDVVEEIGTDGFFAFALPECHFAGHWRALPWRGDTRFATYNTAMFEEAGVAEFPKTFDELIEVGKKLTTFDANGEVDRAGFVINQANSRFDHGFFTLLAGFGGALMNEDYTAYTIDTEEVRNTLQFMQDCLYVHKIFPMTVLDPTHRSDDSFLTGKAAIVLGNTIEMPGNLERNAPQIGEVSMSAVMPSLTGEGLSSIAFSAPVCVFGSTKFPEASKEWLKFFCNTENQIIAMNELSLVSVWKDVLNDESFDNHWYKTVLAQNERAQPGDMPTASFSQVDAFPTGPINDMCNAVMAGGDVAEATARCQAEIEEIMLSLQ